MDKILADIARWLLNKAATLVVVVAILLGALWVKNEWKSLQTRRETADKNESLAKRLSMELEPLEAQIEQAKSQIRETSEPVGCCLGVCHSQVWPQDYTSWFPFETGTMGRVA